MKMSAMEFLPSVDSRPLMAVLAEECEREMLMDAFSALSDLFHDGQMSEARAFITEMFDIAGLSIPGILGEDYDPETLDELVFMFLSDFDDYLEETTAHGW